MITQIINRIRVSRKRIHLQRAIGVVASVEGMTGGGNETECESLECDELPVPGRETSFLLAGR